MSENFDSKDNSWSLADFSCSSEKLKSNLDKSTESRLFSNFWYQNKRRRFKNLLRWLSNEGSNYQTNFWSWLALK